MRTASNQFQASLSRSLQVNQDRITHLTQQMASGQRIELPSDDPLSNVRLSRLNREEAIITQYRDNIATAKGQMQQTETYLSSTVVDMTEAHDLLVWASDGGNAPGDLQSMVNSLVALRDSLFYSSNIKNQEGAYVFSGTLTNVPALSYSGAAALGARYSFSGNTGVQKVVVGNGITQDLNVNLQGMDTLLNQLDVTIANLQVPGVTANTPALRSALTASLDGIDSALNMVSSKIANLGGAQNILSTLDANHSNVSLSNKIALTDIGQLDYGLAATELNGYTTALQATYQAYSKVSKLSLFDLL